ncbi:MAG: amidase [Chloroflexi bacterium]|nr:amidase [Chloroflexota bacterium]
MSRELAFATIAELAPRLAAREISPVEVVRAAVEQAERVQPRINCFISLLPDHAMAAAREAEREIMAGRYRGPLHGIPYSAKDLYATRGIRTTNGGKVTADWVPDFDATAILRMTEAGAVLIGKNNTSEFAAGPTTDNIHYGQGLNPWDTTRIPGGSSGGSGAATAAGAGVFSLGSDTGGSVRGPGSFCGVVGLKPSYGRVSKYGITTMSWSLDTAGTLTRSALDAATLLEALAGHDPLDPSTSHRPVEAYGRLVRDELRGLRIGVPREYFWEAIHPDVEANVRAAIARLGELGAQVREVSMPWIYHSMPAIHVISMVESSTYHDPWMARWATDYGDEILDRCIMGRVFSGADYLRAQQVRKAVVRRAAELFREIDILATPNNPIAAPPISQETVEVNGQVFPTRLGLTRLTRPISVLGLPAIAVPCGFDRDGLPTSVQLVGASFADATVLRAAYHYQQITDWHTRQPPI